MKRNQKWKNPHTVLDRRTLCFSSYKNRKSKVTGGCERKKRAFFVPFTFSLYNVLCHCIMYVLCHCIMYQIRFQSIHTFAACANSLVDSSPFHKSI